MERSENAKAGGATRRAGLCIALLIGAPGLVGCQDKGETFETGPVDLTQWTPILFDLEASGQQSSASWALANSTEVTQTVNADPSILVSDRQLDEQTVEGTWRVVSADDDDFIGFVFGYQNPGQFYVFDWKGATQSGAQMGMSIKRVDSAYDGPLSGELPKNVPPIGGALWTSTPSDGALVTVLDHQATEGWTANTPYTFRLDYEPPSVRIVVRQGDRVIYDQTQLDASLPPRGRFGFYNYSQSGVKYERFGVQPAGGSNSKWRWLLAAIAAVAALLGAALVRRRRKRDRESVVLVDGAGNEVDAVGVLCVPPVLVIDSPAASGSVPAMRWNVGTQSDDVGVEVLLEGRVIDPLGLGTEPSASLGVELDLGVWGERPPAAPVEVVSLSPPDNRGHFALILVVKRVGPVRIVFHYRGQSGAVGIAVFAGELVEDADGELRTLSGRLGDTLAKSYARLGAFDQAASLRKEAVGRLALKGSVGDSIEYRDVIDDARCRFEVTGHPETPVLTSLERSFSVPAGTGARRSAEAFVLFAKTSEDEPDLAQLHFPRLGTPAKIPAASRTGTGKPDLDKQTRGLVTPVGSMLSATVAESAYECGRAVRVRISGDGRLAFLARSDKERRHLPVRLRAEAAGLAATRQAFSWRVVYGRLLGDSQQGSRGEDQAGQEPRASPPQVHFELEQAGGVCQFSADEPGVYLLEARLVDDACGGSATATFMVEVVELSLTLACRECEGHGRDVCRIPANTEAVLVQAELSGEGDLGHSSLLAQSIRAVYTWKADWLDARGRSSVRLSVPKDEESKTVVSAQVTSIYFTTGVRQDHLSTHEMPNGETVVVQPGEPSHVSVDVSALELTAQLSMEVQRAPLPLLLAGPILRRTEPTRVCVWIATSASVTGRCTVYRGQARIGSGEAIDEVRLGEHLFVTLYAALPDSGQFPTDVLLSYDLALTERDGDREYDSLVDIVGETLSFFSHGRPTFALRSTLPWELLQGSCRKLHGPGDDALEYAESALAVLANDPSRPAALFLTGDQIYADDVAPGLIEVIEDLSAELLGKVETLPGRDHLDGEPIGTTVPIPAGASRAEIAKSAGFTSGHAAHHLLRFGEWAAMYLLAWSDVSWPTSGLGPELAASRRVLGAVRRLLANIPTYMIFDDHEITDDWNITSKAARFSLLQPGRRIIANGLAAYWAFQQWGNDPDAFAPDELVLKHLQSAAPDNASALLFERELLRGGSNFVAPTPQPALFVDTRKDRVLNQDEPPILLGERSYDELSALASRFGVGKDAPALLVSPGPVLGQHPIEAAQRLLGRFGGHAAADNESWTAHADGLLALIDFLTTKIRSDTVIVLSGDVHYSFTASATLQRGPPKPTAPSTRVVQLTNSALKNATRDLGKRDAIAYLSQYPDIPPGLGDSLAEIVSRAWTGYSGPDDAVLYHGWRDDPREAEHFLEQLAETAGEVLGGRTGALLFRYFRATGAVHPARACVLDDKQIKKAGMDPATADWNEVRAYYPMTPPGTTGPYLEVENSAALVRLEPKRVTHVLLRSSAGAGPRVSVPLAPRNRS